jgi:hypothetical protein
MKAKSQPAMHGKEGKKEKASYLLFVCHSLVL